MSITWIPVPTTSSLGTTICICSHSRFSSQHHRRLNNKLSKRMHRFGLTIIFGLLAAVQGLAGQGETPVARTPQTPLDTPGLVRSSATRPTGIEIVPSLEKPKNARKLEEKDLAGYLLVYFK